MVIQGRRAGLGSKIISLCPATEARLTQEFIPECGVSRVLRHTSRISGRARESANDLSKGFEVALVQIGPKANQQPPGIVGIFFPARKKASSR